MLRISNASWKKQFVIFYQGVFCTKGKFIQEKVLLIIILDKPLKNLLA